MQEAQLDDISRGTGNTARLIEDDDGQSLRLPEGHRLDAKEVRIRREGDALVLEPVIAEKSEETRQREWDEIFANLGEPFSDDMVEAALNRPGPDEYDRLDCDLRLKD